MLSDLGFRRIERIWVRGSDDDRWYNVDEKDVVGFEAEIFNSRGDNGDDDTGRPTFFHITGPNFGLIRITRTPDKDYQGRIDGIVDTPMVQRLTELPGPREYHETVALMAAGFHIQANGLKRLNDSQNEFEAQKANMIAGRGQGFINQARQKISHLMRDTTPNRLADWEPRRIPLYK